MERVSIKNVDGTTEEADVVNVYKIGNINKNFIILSKGESAGARMSKIYISEFVESQPGVYNLLGISDESTWNMVKQAMQQIVES